MEDLISRQAAIDACLELLEARRKWDTAEGRAEMRGIDAVVCAIHDLPSAQPDHECQKCISANSNSFDRRSKPWHAKQN